MEVKCFIIISHGYDYCMAIIIKIIEKSLIFLAKGGHTLLFAKYKCGITKEECPQRLYKIVHTKKAGSLAVIIF